MKVGPLQLKPSVGQTVVGDARGGELIDLSDPRTPTWEELELEGHIFRLRVALALFFLCLVTFWLWVLDGVVLPPLVLNALLLVGAVDYLLLVWSAYKIQDTLHASGLYKHGGWQVWAGALILNPAVLGWWIPASVLLSAGGVRRQLAARWPNGRTGTVVR